MPLSVTSWLIRVPSRNQRMTSTACLKQPNARVPVRVPRRCRSACSKLETNSTVCSRTDSVAVYVTLILDAEPHMKLICGRTTFIPGFCVFSLYRNDSGASPLGGTSSYAASPAVTRNGSLPVDNATYQL